MSLIRQNGTGCTTGDFPERWFSPLLYHTTLYLPIQRFHRNNRKSPYYVISLPPQLNDNVVFLILALHNSLSASVAIQGRLCCCNNMDFRDRDRKFNWGNFGFKVVALLTGSFSCTTFMVETTPTLVSLWEETGSGNRKQNKTISKARGKWKLWWIGFGT